MQVVRLLLSCFLRYTPHASPPTSSTPAPPLPRHNESNLPVTAVKPDLPYVILTKLVIASSPRKMLTLNQVSCGLDHLN